MYKLVLAEREALARTTQLDPLRDVRLRGGSRRAPDGVRRVFQADIAEGYGLTEGGPVPITNTRWGLKKRGSCGREIPAVTCGSWTRRAVTWLRTRWASCSRAIRSGQGYWKLPEVTASKLRDGWLSSGDLLRRDADGYYYFVGRKDDMMNVAGENVYPKEVEDILLRHPNLRDACVVPAPHGTKGVCPWPSWSSARRAGPPRRT